MVRHLALILFLPSLFAVACGRQSAEPSDAYLSKQLDSLRRDYTTGDLYAALDRARDLRSYTDSFPAHAAASERAELFQYLAQMHFHGGLFLDSIKYYVRRAQETLPATASAALQARQYLCEGYGEYNDFNWLDLAMLARLGQLTLRPRTVADSLLYAELRIAEARAGKQYGRDLQAPELSDAWMQDAEHLIRDAGRYLPPAVPTWRAYRHEQLFFQVLNDLERKQELLAMMRDAGRAPLNAQPYFAVPARLKGSYYKRLNRPDSVILYDLSVAAREGFFAARSMSEATFLLDWAYTTRKAFDRSIHHNRRYARLRHCCPEELDLTSPHALLSCDRFTSCVHIVAREGEIYRNWAIDSGNPTLARRALDYAEYALNGFQSSFSDYDEHAVLSKNITVGSRILTTALHTALPTDSTVVSRRRKELLFRSMELSRSLLLTRDLIQLGVPDSSGVQSANRRDILRRDLLRKDYSERVALSLAELEEYRELRNRQSAYTDAFLSETEAAAAIHRAADRGPDLAEVQQTLSPQDALFEFTVSDGRLFALYVDPDTTLAYSLAAAEVLTCSEAFSALLQQPTRPSVTAYTALARTLYDQLLGPAAEFAAERERWIVAPAHELNDLPLAALLASAPPPGAAWSDLPYLVHDHEIRYVPSYRTDGLLAARRRPLDPASANAGVWTHPNLRYYLGDLANDLLVGISGHHYLADDNRETYVARSADYDLLHLSVHAGGNPLQLHENYLHLTEEQRLNGLTVARQRLPARLVVLAACSTASGFTGGSEGTYSLRRSFHQAGVPDVVASVYDIPAAATATLLAAFYRYLFEGAEPAAALSRAQREIAAGRRSWPGGWAGVIVG